MNRFAHLIAALCLVATVVPVRGQIVDGLYDVDVAIVDRSSEARAGAATEALRLVLVRVTGLAQLPPNAVINAALRNPDRYYVRYGFTEELRDGEQITKLRVRFAEGAVLRLVSEAGLPLWSSNRPVFMVWAAVDGIESPVEVLSAGSTHPLAGALQERAQARGLPLVLPIMDLDDQLAVPIDAVLGGVTLVLREAAARYGADGLLIVRARGGVEGPWDVSGRMVLLDAESEFAFAAPSPDSFAAAMVDPAVDLLVARYAVQAGDEGRLEFRVEGISDIGAYAAALRYLDGLEYIDTVSVDRVERHALYVSVITRTPWSQLKDLLDLDARLVAISDTGLGIPSQIPLLWRGDSR